MRKALSLFKNELFRIVVSAVFFVSALLVEHFASQTVALVLYLIALIACGLPVFGDAVIGIVRLDFLDEKFLMSIASVGAMIVGEWSEGVAVMLFFLVGEFFEHKAVAHSRNSIRALMDIRPDVATVIKDGEETEADADEVEEGSVIIVRSGERVPIDATVIEGSSDIDTSALTGESVPRTVGPGDTIESGTVVVNGVLRAKTIRTADESAASRVLALVEDANEAKSKEESFITKFSRIYTPVVVILAILIAIVPPIFSLMSFGDSVYKALIFLVVSCPCALVISVPMAFFGGIGGAASKGILFKGGNVFAPISRLETVAFDKTGTLTKGTLTVNRVETHGEYTEAEVLIFAASAEYVSNHPVAEALKLTAGKAHSPEKAEELPGRGVRAMVDGKTVLVGNAKLMEENGVEFEEDKINTSYVFVAVGGELVGIVYLKDEIKIEAASAISSLRSCGAKRIAIISGDKANNAEAIAKEVGISEVYADLSPEGKYSKLEELISNSKGSCAFVGDGINDAPALARADVGIAMGGIGSDSAIEAADVVLMSDDLEKLPLAVRISRKTIGIAKQNIFFAISVKLLIMILGVLGFANMWLAVFADVGVAVIAILNSMRALKSK